MNRRDFVGTLCAALGTGALPAKGRGATTPDGWTPVREWTIPESGPFASLAPALPILLVDVGRGLTRVRLEGAYGGRLPVGVVELFNPGGLPLAETFCIVREGRTKPVPLYGVLERKGAEERFRLIMPDRDVVLNRNWAERALEELSRG